jgi:hypothetical protein
MATKYRALDKFIIELDVLNELATSGTADKTAVDDTGERKAQNERTRTMMFFLRGVNFW